MVNAHEEASQWRTAASPPSVNAHEEAHMDGLQQLGIEGAEVADEPVAKNVLIGVGGVLLVIAALIPITAAVITVVVVVTAYGGAMLGL
jgi:hypothetical protein